MELTLTVFSFVITTADPANGQKKKWIIGFYLNSFIHSFISVLYLSIQHLSIIYVTASNNFHSYQ